MQELPQTIIIYSGNVNVVKKIDYGSVSFCVTDRDGSIIVPYGKYGWIDAFDHGFARVADQLMNTEIDMKTGNERHSKWGLITEKGEEVLPVMLDSIWNFKDKGLSYTRVKKSGCFMYFNFITQNLEPIRPILTPIILSPTQIASYAENAMKFVRGEIDKMD